MRSLTGGAEIHPEALRELAEAIGRYEDEYPGRGVRFHEALTRKFDQMRAAPLSFPRWRKRLPVRYAAVPRFPYTVFFTAEGVPVVYAVAHNKRRPGYWIRRLALRLA